MTTPLSLLTGLGGSPRLLDIGGPPYLTPVPDKTRVRLPWATCNSMLKYMFLHAKTNTLLVVDRVFGCLIMSCDKQ